MPSINLIKASDGTGNASTATVQTVRNSGVTTIIVDTVNNIPATFMGSMGTPHTFVDPVTSEEITVISEATAVDFTGHVSGANLEIDSIAPGYTDLGSAVGDIIVIRPTTDWGNNVAAVLEVAHENDGTLKAGAISSLNMIAATVLNNIYPVGSVYINAAVATNPATLLGFGTWVAFGEGRVVVGKSASGTFATAGATGGAETHTLTTAEMPSHTHGFSGAQYVVAGLGGANDRTQPGAGSNAGLIDMRTSSSAGSGGAHNNLQPYVVVYMWKRTA